MLTLEWIDGLKLNDRAALIAAGHDTHALAEKLIRAFLRQAISDGFFHADMHQGNLFALADGRIAAIDFGIMGRIDRRARVWLAEILYGLITGNYKRVAEIHFEAGYVPAHHNVAEFASALRAVGRADARAAGEGDVGGVDARRAVQHHPRLRHADPAAPAAAPEDDGDGGRRRAHARSDINLWESAAPFVREWIRTELGPEAKVADRIVEDVRTLLRLPQLIRNIEAKYPNPGGAPPAPPLKQIERITVIGGWRYVAVAVVSAAITAAAIVLLIR